MKDLSAVRVDGAVDDVLRLVELVNLLLGKHQAASLGESSLFFFSEPSDVLLALLDFLVEHEELERVSGLKHGKETTTEG